jgi:hypothetical protein
MINIGRISTIYTPNRRLSSSDLFFIYYKEKANKSVTGCFVSNNSVFGFEFNELAN